jgi:hypothetical protein
MLPLLRRGIPLNSDIPFMKVRCACPRQQHVQEAITPFLLSRIFVLRMASVVDEEMKATK